MKKLIYSLTLILGLSSASALTGCSSYKDDATAGMSKEQRKEYYAKVDAYEAAQAMQAVKGQRFVASAFQLSTKRGDVFNVSTTTNFVSLNGTDAVIQIASTGSISGPNGIGGITLRGTASDIKIKEDKRGNITLSMRVQGSGRSGDVTLRMGKGSTRASVEVSGTFSSSRITMQTYVKPFDQATHVVGTSL